VTVLLTVSAGLALAWTVARRFRALQAAMSTWMFVAIVQGAVGYAQYFAGVPELLVGVHIAGATMLWVVTVRLALSALDAVKGGEPVSADSRPPTRRFGSPVANV
jgi:cytochrome c oxidase assembly protein subunit 15